MAAYPVGLSERGRRPSVDLGAELARLRLAREEVRARGHTTVALVGRSFGGRVCARLAAAEPGATAALVLLGHPIAPSGRPRPADEAALAAVRCPTLIVQGDRDRLGPLAVLERIVAANPALHLHVLADAGHTFGRHESTAVAIAGDWLCALFAGDPGARRPSPGAS